LGAGEEGEPPIGTKSKKIKSRNHIKSLGGKTTRQVHTGLEVQVVAVRLEPGFRFIAAASTQPILGIQAAQIS
jgi:hypothetical protein